MKTLHIHLRDRNLELIAAWKKVLQTQPWVKIEISSGSIFDNTSADAIISPANSFGFMDGGIDLVYSNYFGWELSKTLQQHIDSYWNGELLVGQAAIIEIPDNKFKYLISAPTMRVPENISNTANAYLAFRAVLQVATHHPYINSILCPGLGTSVGLMPPEICARQIKFAIDEIDPITGLWKPRKFPTLLHAKLLHHQL